MAKKKKAPVKKTGGFYSFGFNEPIMRAIVKKGYKTPTPIQRKGIPLFLEGHDLLAMARTGSGKTAAFLLPILQKLQQHNTVVGVRALVLCPTRDLTLQTEDFVKQLGKFTDLRCVTLVGGESIERQFELLSTNPDILIASPGRLLHLLVETQMSLKTVEIVIFDEADSLFAMGFAGQINEILQRLSPNRQTCLFSATLPPAIIEFTRAGLKDPKMIRLDTEHTLSENLSVRPVLSALIDTLCFLSENLFFTQ